MWSDLCTAGFSFLHISSTSVNANIGELREMVCVVHDELTRRSFRLPSLMQLCTSTSAQTLAVHGIAVLESCLRGAWLHTLKDVLALMHVALALAYILHGDDDSFDWNNHSRSMLQWQQMLLNEHEVDLFLRVLATLSYTPISSTASLTPNSRSARSTCDLIGAPLMKDCSIFLDGKLM